MQAIGEEVYEQALGRKPSEETKALLRNFARLYGIDFCPVYSILGSVASQEFIVVISRTSEPALNWFCYDSQKGYGLTEAVQDIKAFPAKHLPERRQEIVDEAW